MQVREHFPKRLGRDRSRVPPLLLGDIRVASDIGDHDRLRFERIHHDHSGASRLGGLHDIDIVPVIEHCNQLLSTDTRRGGRRHMVSSCYG